MSETTRDVELEALARQLREALHGAEGIAAVEERLILAALRRVQPEPSAEGPTRAQVEALIGYTAGCFGFGEVLSRGEDTFVRRKDVLATFAPPAADAEPEKEPT